MYGVVMKICPKCLETFPKDSAFCPFHGVILVKSEDEWIGKTIDNRFQIVEKIGEGGMGKVYKAVQSHPERFVAIKILPANAMMDASKRRRFEREGLAVSMIQHDHIIKIYDAGESEQGNPFLAMEYLQGKSLEIAMLGEPLPVDRAVDIMKQICEALGPTHALGIVHRDLKPGNIFLVNTQDGSDFIKILDFGIAFLTSEPRLTDKGIVIGTPEYMSPELVSGKPIGQASDLYSLGCVAYEMLSGEAPFYHRVPSKIMVMQVKEKPKPLIEIAKGIPPALSDIVMKLLRKDPEKRQQDAYIVMNELSYVKVESETRRPTIPQDEERKQKQVPTITSRPLGRSALWKTYVSGARTMAKKAEKAEKQKVNMKILEEMEELCFEMEGIEKQQAALSATMEKIEGEKTDAIGKLRHALEVLAREISDKNKILATVTREIGDIEFQVGEIRKRMEALESEASGESNEIRGSLQKFESRRLGIKDRLAKLSATPSMELLPKYSAPEV